ncbi:hypothetical protein PCI56_06625 [Plesiomonas shigelloides subsp. oncorhynchi]|nr:hypothetical protein [Plesiomonas shigelloides]
MMNHLVSMNERIEYMSAQLVKSIGSPEAITLVKLYEVMIKSRSTKVLFDIGLNADPINVLENKSLSDCSESLGKTLKPIKTLILQLAPMEKLPNTISIACPKTIKRCATKCLKF